MGASVWSCALIASAYVGVLYAGSDNRRSRDDPRVIWRRSLLVALVCAFAWLPAQRAFPDDAPHELAARLGLRADGALHASAAALGLCALLFAAPLWLGWSDYRHGRTQPPAWDAVHWRNLVVAPLAEEFAFRACMCPLLLHDGWGHTAVVLGCPLFFGLAHVHHAWELCVVRGVPLRLALLTAACQATYTTVFGSFATLLLLRTGTLAAPLLAHTFCNWQGLPDFRRILRHSGGLRALLVGGVAAFAVALHAFCTSSTWASF